MTKRQYLPKFFLYILVFLQTGPLSSQPFSGGFNFNLPANDSLPQRFLPFFPAKTIAEADRITASGSQFMVGSKPIKFWGVNIVAAAAFPPKDKAVAIAARLRKMGVNLVRFHHLENTWSGADGTIFNYPIGTRQLNPTTLDRLDFLIAQLKRNNIYVNMNLNVSREFKAIDGVQGSDSLPDFAKAVTLFDPWLQFLQREYAQQLLGHTNPYTGQSLANDPVLAMVEMNNENSIYAFWKEDRLRLNTEGGSLIFRHNRLLDSLHQNFLIQKYGTNANLQTAWQTSGAGAAPEIFQNGGFETGSVGSPWFLEQYQGAGVTFTATNTTSRSGTFSGQLNVTNYTGTDWHIQMKQTGFSMQKDTSYELSFWAKGSANLNFTLTFMQDISPYNWYNGTTLTTTTAWKKYTYIITIPVNEPNPRMTISPKSTGTIWFDDFSFKKVVPKGLDANESLTNRNVERILWSGRGQYAPQRAADNAQFYILLQKKHVDSLRFYLKNTLNVRAPITGANALVGVADAKHQENMDYVDDHSYWDHPQFTTPDGSWSDVNWRINNTPQIKSQDLGAIISIFSGLAMTDKPYTISEFQHAAPNRFRSEMPATWLAYGSLHGADAVMFFEYSGDNSGWDSDVTNNFFSIHRDNSIMALFPTCAYAFRQGLVKEDNAPIKLSYTEGSIFSQNQIDRNGRWQLFQPHDKRLALLRGIKTDSYSATANVAAPAFVAPTNNVYVTATNETQLDLTKGILTTSTPNYATITGFLADNANATTGKMTLLQADQFGSITWLAVVNAPLNTASRSLLTLSTKQQNTNMTWTGTNTVSNQWGNAPTLQQPAYVRLRLTIQADSIKLYPLSTTGADSRFLKILPSATNTFDIILDQNTDKTLWYGIEAFGSQIITSVDDPQLPVWNSLFPNPVCDGQLTLDYTLSQNGQTTIVLYDLLGRLVKTISNENGVIGRQQKTVNLSDVSNGQYQVVITQSVGSVNQSLQHNRPVFMPVTVIRH